MSTLFRETPEEKSRLTGTPPDLILSAEFDRQKNHKGSLLWPNMD
jgi:hypothetical protein